MSYVIQLFSRQLTPRDSVISREDLASLASGFIARRGAFDSFYNTQDSSSNLLS